MFVQQTKIYVPQYCRQHSELSPSGNCLSLQRPTTVWKWSVICIWCSYLDVNKTHCILTLHNYESKHVTVLQHYNKKIFWWKMWIPWPWTSTGYSTCAKSARQVATGIPWNTHHLTKQAKTFKCEGELDKQMEKWLPLFVTSYNAMIHIIYKSEGNIQFQNNISEPGQASLTWIEDLISITMYQYTTAKNK